MDDWDKSWLVDECPLCDICGRQYIHWNGCPKSYSLPSNPYYDSSVICDVGRGDETENAKQEALECTYMLDKVNSKIAEQMFECVEGQKTIMKFLYELDAIQLEITDLEIATQQRESYEEAEIVSQSWLQEQTQLLKFHESIRDGLTYMTIQLIEGRVELTQDIDQFGSNIYELEAHWNKKIEASDAQLLIVVDDDQLVERKEEFQPFNYTLFLNIDVEKEYKNENVVKNAALELRQLESHSKHFSIKFEPMDECIDEEQGPYILKCFSPRRQNDIPHLRAKKCKVLEKSEYLEFGAKEHV